MPHLFWNPKKRWVVTESGSPNFWSVSCSCLRILPVVIPWSNPRDGSFAGPEMNFKEQLSEKLVSAAHSEPPLGCSNSFLSHQMCSEQLFYGDPTVTCTTLCIHSLAIFCWMLFGNSAGWYVNTVATFCQRLTKKTQQNMAMRKSVCLKHVVGWMTL